MSHHPEERPMIRLLLILGVALIAGCRQSPEDARRELAALGLEYTEEGFLESTARGDFLAVQKYIAAEMSPNVQGKYLKTPLCEAIRLTESKDRQSIITFLLEHGANPNADCRPLIRAARQGDLKVTTDLLKAGADPNLREVGEQMATTAVCEAFKRERHDVVKALIAAGADPNVEVGTTYSGREVINTKRCIPPSGM